MRLHAHRGVGCAQAVRSLGELYMENEAPSATIYYDGSCPLCRAEITHYQTQAGSENLCFVDVSADSVDPGPGLDRAAALKRFHIRKADGELISGAAAFAAVWQHLPGWRWAWRLTRVPLVLPAMEVGYRAFLPVRPLLSRLFGRLSGS